MSVPNMIETERYRMSAACGGGKSACVGGEALRADRHCSPQVRSRETGEESLSTKARCSPQAFGEILGEAVMEAGEQGGVLLAKLGVSESSLRGWRDQGKSPPWGRVVAMARKMPLELLVKVMRALAGGRVLILGCPDEGTVEKTILKWGPDAARAKSAEVSRIGMEMRDLVDEAVSRGGRVDFRVARSLAARAACLTQSTGELVRIAEREAARPAPRLAAARAGMASVGFAVVLGVICLAGLAAAVWGMAR